MSAVTPEQLVALEQRIEAALERERVLLAELRAELRTEVVTERLTVVGPDGHPCITGWVVDDAAEITLFHPTNPDIVAHLVVSEEMVDAQATLLLVVGDRTELATLNEVYIAAGARPGSCALGSVKSQIGHTKCAAGLAGLIKIALALQAARQQQNDRARSNANPLGGQTPGGPGRGGPGGGGGGNRGGGGGRG